MKIRYVAWAVCLTMGLLVLAPQAKAEEPIKVLFLTKSSGFQHSVIARENNKLGHAEKLLIEFGKKNGLEVFVTKDAGMINATQLPLFDVVMFYTTGDLTQPSKDNATPMSQSAVDELVQWVSNGGGWFGSHTAADTFHNNETYRKLSGGVFKTHGNQEEAKLTIENHPITKGLDRDWVLMDEYYIFKDVTSTVKTPLIILETKSMKQEAYTQLDPYPIAWCEELGEGRIVNCALGHREDVWTNEKYQQLIVNGIKWAAKKLN